MEGTSVYRIGDNAEPTANFWNNYIHVPVSDSDLDNRILTIELTGTQVLFVSDKIFLENSIRSQKIVTLQWMLTNALLVFFMGGSMIIGLLLIAMSFHSKRLQLSSRLIGIAGILITIWVFDTTFRYSTASMPIYTFVKRFVLIAVYTGGFFFCAALDHYHAGKFTISRWCLIPTVLCVGAVLAAPTVGTLYSCLPLLNSILIINTLVSTILIYMNLRKYPLLIRFVEATKTLLRQEDMLIRFGRDEFLILLKSANEKESILIAERIQREFKAVAEDVRVDLSYGSATIHPDVSFDLEDIDQKMYAMKEKKKRKGNP